MPTDEVLQRQRKLLQRIRLRFRLPEQRAYQQVADALSIKNRSSIYGWESGRNSISPSNLNAIANKLNTTEAQLTKYLEGAIDLDALLPLEPKPNNLQSWVEDAILKLPLLTPKQRRYLGQRLLALIAEDLDSGTEDFESLLLQNWELLQAEFGHCRLQAWMSQEKTPTEDEKIAIANILGLTKQDVENLIHDRNSIPPSPNRSASMEHGSH